MDYEVLVGRDVFLQNYFAKFNWGSILSQLAMTQVPDEENMQLSPVMRFMGSKANLGVVGATDLNVLNESLAHEKSQNGLVLVKSSANRELNTEIEQSGLVAVWAREINSDILGNAFLDLLARR